ncbi:MAG: hypothetical protein ABI758_00655 [Candidatus Woesebacteria bacterium]
MRKELCAYCVTWQKCFYEDISLNGLQQALEHGNTTNCPQFPSLLAEALDPGTISSPEESIVSVVEQSPLETVETMIPQAEDIEKIIDNTPPIEGEIPKPRMIETIIFKRLPTKRETVQVKTNGKQRDITNGKAEKGAGTPKRSTVSISLREYIDVQDYLAQTDVSERLRSAFGYITEAIDKLGKYTQDLDYKEKERLGKIITRILETNDVFEDYEEALHFLKALKGIVTVWTVNTKGKNRNEIQKFDLNGST